MSLLTAVSPLASLILGKKKAPKPPAVAPVARMRTNGGAADALSARRGSRANQRTGRGGAEAASSGKTKLGG